MKNDNNTEIRNEIVNLVKGYVVVMVLSTTIVVAASMILYWNVKESYFPDISPFVSHISLLVFTGLMFHISSHMIFNYYFRRHFLDPEKKPAWLQELDAHRKKIIILEEHIVSLKGRQNSMNVKDTKLADPRTDLIMHERVFIHDASNIITVLIHRASRIAEELEKINTKETAVAMEQIVDMEVKLEKLAKLLEENREFLIIAA
jgi:hypothetical protein